MQKMPPDCTQEHVFWHKNASASAFVWLEKRKETVATQSKTHETQWQSIILQIKSTLHSIILKLLLNQTKIETSH